MRFEKHIFICANQKAEGKACCGTERGMELVEKFREVLAEKGLKGKVRAQRSGCLDACTKGPALVVYPDGTYYGGVTPDDVERIVNEHIIGNKVVEALELKYE
ncbi:MAG: (2Fe-2S) ferredoxin domain-containing protein [Bacteroidota bacterium]